MDRIQVQRLVLVCRGCTARGRVARLVHRLLAGRSLHGSMRQKRSMFDRGGPLYVFVIVRNFTGKGLRPLVWMEVAVVGVVHTHNVYRVLLSHAYLFVCGRLRS